MPSTRDIRRRIKSVKNTAQITKAMQMVAASKMRKAQQAALARASLARLLNRDSAAQPRRASAISAIRCWKCATVRKRAVILVGTDKGLCGALNSNLFRVAAQFDPHDDRVHHRRAQGGAVHRAHPAAAGGGVYLTRTRRGLPKRGRSPSLPATCS